MRDKIGSAVTMLAFLGMCGLGVPKEGLVFVASTLALGLVMALITQAVMRRG